MIRRHAPEIPLCLFGIPALKATNENETMNFDHDIIGKARRLLDLQAIFKDTLDTNGSLSTEQAAALAEFADLSNDIVKDLIRAPHVVTDDPSVRNLINQIVGDRAQEVESMGDMVDEDEIDAYRDDFWPADYTARMLKLPVTFTKHPIPAALAELIEELRRCYATHHYTASVALCRTILEKAVTDIAIERGDILPPTEADYFQDYPPYMRFDIVLGRHTETRTKIANFYRYASRVIHGAEEPDEAIAKRALEFSLKLVTQILDERS
jgi:hypothetical protein